MTPPVTPATPRLANDAGAVLAFVILMMLGLLTLAHGVLVASLSELAVSRAAVRHLEVRGAAELGVRRALAETPGPWMDSVPLWQERVTGPYVSGRAEGTGLLRRIGPESWAVEGEGRLSRGTARTVHMAWALDPLVRVTSLDAVVTVRVGAPVTLAGTVDASAPASVVPPLQQSDCEPWLDDLVARYDSRPLAVAAFLPDSTTPPGLGLLALQDLLGAAPVSVSGSGTPMPAETFGACSTGEAWNWGDPDQPWRPCGGHLALRSSTGDLTVLGGAGQGLLVVDGAVILDAGARFFGLVVASGELRLEGGSSFEGMALAGGGLVVEPGASLRGSACWAVRALDTQREALGGLRPVAAGRLGPF